VKIGIFSLKVIEIDYALKIALDRFVANLSWQLRRINKTILASTELALITTFSRLICMSSSSLIKSLGYAGLIPFLVPVYLMGQGFLSADGLQSAAVFGLYAPYVFIAYSAVILSFLSGTLWAHASQAQEFPGDESLGEGALIKSAIVFSNLLALSAWMSLLLIYIAPIMTLFAVCLLLSGYLGLMLVERLVSVQQDRSYWQMRIQLTAVVAIAHLAIMVMMMTEL